MSDSIENTIPETPETFFQKEANTVAQALNVVFNNATFYGSGHPSTRKSGEEFVGRLHRVFMAIPLVTFLRNGDSFFIEKWCVDHKINVARFLGIFQKAGVESVSFEQGLALHEVQTFIRVFSDLQMFPAVKEMHEEFQKQKVEKIKINYVFFQKVTKDEEVVQKDLRNTPERDKQVVKIADDFEIIHTQEPFQQVPERTHDNDQVLTHITKLFTLKDIIDNPDHVAHNVIVGAEKGLDQAEQVLHQLREINRQFSRDVSRGQTVSADDMMESMFKLTEELQQKLSVQKEMGKILHEEEQIIDEANKLTYQAIVLVIREEYKQGTVSIKRVGQIIRRILPNVKDLKKLLPQLKDGLLAEGMPLADFLDLTRELNKELESDGLLAALEESADRIGLSVEEIVQAIQENPNEAAKIIVLASEIKKNAGNNQSELTDLLTDYIESISESMALQSNNSGGLKDGGVLEQIIQRIETHLVSKLKGHGVDNSVVGEVEEQLAKRFPKTLSKLKADWMVNFITSGKDLSSTNLVHLLGTIVNTPTDIDTVKGPIENALQAHGFDQEQVEAVFQEIADRIESRKKTVTLPKDILSGNNTVFFLQRLIKENIRYHNPFSCISVSINAQFRDGAWKVLQKDDVIQVMPHICMLIRKALRDIDLIGSLGKKEDVCLCLLLPMTDETGAYTVKKRLEKKLMQPSFLLDGNRVELNVVIAVTTFSQEKTPDFKSFRALIDTHHKIEEDIVKKMD